jgi:hypothetical protein
MPPRLRYRPKLSVKEAIEKISTHAIWGDHSVEPRPRTIGEVAQLLLRLGTDPDMVAQECRDYRVAVPYFENLVPTQTFTVVAASVELADSGTFESIGPRVTGPATVSLASYSAQFQSAWRLVIVPWSSCLSASSRQLRCSRSLLSSPS